jgi:hypothetical protein
MKSIGDNHGLNLTQDTKPPKSLYIEVRKYILLKIMMKMKTQGTILIYHFIVRPTLIPKMDKSSLILCVCVCGGRGNVPVHTMRAYGGVEV